MALNGSPRSPQAAMAQSQLSVTIHPHRRQVFHRPSMHPTPLSHVFLSSQWHAKKKPSAAVVHAILWGRDKGKQSDHPSQGDIFLSAERIAHPNLQEGETTEKTSPLITVSVVPSMSLIPPKDWDLCATESAGVGTFNPFVTHAFLSSLEDSHSAAPVRGWSPQHLVARDEIGNVLGVVPLYLKSHSYGEYVFDHSWANAYYRFGGSYYPKLQCCVPFTPVTGPRILIRDCSIKEQVADGLLKSMQQLAHEFQVSSLHITFPPEEEWKKMGNVGFLQRVGMQYHWLNDGYESFDAFLMNLRQSKRKTIRQERKKVQLQNIKFKRLRGDDIKAHHWETFYLFYRNTTDNKWGQAYLTKEFFYMLGSRLGDQVMLIVAEDQGEVVAGALNLIGGDTLFGRLWGCLPQAYYPNLHFETCYYQAIDAAIEWKMKKVEAGAQGEHKIQRGYIPTTTYSAHYFPDTRFKQAVKDFLRQESSQVNLAIDVLSESGPFKRETR